MSQCLFRCRAYAALLLSFLALLLAAPGHAADFPRLIPLPPPLWKVGDGWGIIVERFPPTGPPVTDPVGGKSATADKPARYTMHVIITKLLKPTGEPHWQLNFLLPNPEEAPAGVEGDYRLLVRQEDGAAYLVGRKGTSLDDAVREVGEVRVVTAPPDGIPLELFFEPLDYEQDEFKNAQGTLTLHRQVDGPKLIVEATYQPTGGEAIMVRQTWVQGEKWWRDYERYRGGRKELHAWLPLRPGAKSLNEKTTPPQQPLEPDDDGQRRDARLQKILSFELPHPRLSDLTNRVHDATGVPLTLQDGLARETPKLGGQSFRDAPAWMVMRQAATLVGPDPRWEKQQDGYHLHGAWPPPAAPMPGVLQEAGPDSAPRWWLTGGTVLFVVALACWSIYNLRKRSTRQRT